MRKALSLVALAAAMALPSHAAFAAGGADTLTAGTTAPNFTLPSQENQPVSLADYKGKWVVLYFYPKDQTSGCTIEAHNFQRDQAKYDALNAIVLGVSLDTVDSHKAFCTKDNLTFHLLADPDHKAIDAYGVPIKSMAGMQYASRQTFLINPEGKIVKVWPDVKVTNHSEEVLAEIDAQKK